MFSLIRRVLLLITVFFLMACTHVDEITPQKYVSLVVAHTAKLKIEIAKSLKTKSEKVILEAGPLQLIPPPGLAPIKFDFGWVTKGGGIIIQSFKYGVIVIQEPSLDEKNVVWSCIVYPDEAKPNLCGSDYENQLLQDK